LAFLVVGIPVYLLALAVGVFILVIGTFLILWNRSATPLSATLAFFTLVSVFMGLLGLYLAIGGASS